MEYPLSEIIDRLSILMLKAERLPNNPHITRDLTEFRRAYEAYKEPRALDWLNDQRAINEDIWGLEADIGRIALRIRELNAERVRRKNAIATAMGERLEIKLQHASE